jgi:VanZ family protein
VPPWRKFLIWLPTLIWIGVLASFSTDTFSAEHTGGLLRRIMDVVYPGISEHAFKNLHFLVRKSAHFGSYGFLSLLAFFSWRATLPTGERWNIRWMRIALVMTLIAACLDEIHQTFVYSRTGSYHDVILDMAGALFFQGAIAWWMLRRDRRESAQARVPVPNGL